MQLRMKCMAFSPKTFNLYLTACDHAHNELFVLPISDILDKLAIHPSLPLKYVARQPLTYSGALSAIQIPPNGRPTRMFPRSSLRGPNDVLLILSTISKPTCLKLTAISCGWHTRTGHLVGKTLRSPEDVYFEGAEGKQVHGFVVEPHGWKEDGCKEWLGLLFIHGGTSAP